PSRSVTRSSSSASCGPVSGRTRSPGSPASTPSAGSSSRASCGLPSRRSGAASRWPDPVALYRLLFRTVLVRMDPERAHELALALIRGVAAVPVLSHLVRASIGRRPDRVGGVLGRPVPGVLGLAAGMDKDAGAVLGMDMLGFG